MVKDSLSALLDGECSGPELDRLLDELDRSPELAREWSRLCLAREARAGTRVTAGQPCICSGVMDALDAAPAADAKVVDLAVHRASRRSGALAGLWKPAVGFAAAASMGAAAVMFIQPESGSAPGTAPRTAFGATLAGWGGAGPATLRTASSEEDAHAQMLREYLMDHSNAVADEGMGSTLRYARFAAHTAEYRPHTDEQP